MNLSTIAHDLTEHTAGFNRTHFPDESYFDLIATTQANDGICALIDIAGTLNPDRAEQRGVDVNTLYVMQPEQAQSAIEVAATLLKSGAVDVVVVADANGAVAWEVAR